MISFATDLASVEQLAVHLQRCDSHFKPSLSTRVDIAEYARKLGTRATRFEAWADRQLIGLAAAYLNFGKDSVSYISNVSVDPTWVRQGIAGRLLRDCIESGRRRGAFEFRLELARADSAAFALYSKASFTILRQDGGRILMSLHKRGPGENGGHESQL